MLTFKHNILIAILILLSINGFATDNGTIITECSVGDIKIGDNTATIKETLKSRYTIKIVDRPNSSREISVFKNGTVIMKLSLKDDRVFLIDVYAQFSTSKKIHSGSTLTEVFNAYGKGKINPTDSGYYVYFDGMPGIQFLINNNDVPDKLRNIPDDVISEEQEEGILNLKNAKISSIQIYCNRKND